MPVAVYLEDSSGQAWQLGASNLGAYTTTPAAAAAQPFILLNDTGLNVVWRMTVLVSGALRIDPSGGTGVNTIPVQSPNGTLWAIVVTRSAISTIPGVPDVPCFPIVATTQATPIPFPLSEAQSALAARLYDPTMQFWSPGELISLIQEALREWNAFSAYQRGDFTFPSIANQTWYDLTIQANSLRPFTVTDLALAQQIEYSLLEPLTTTYPLTWTGSAQFAISDILAAIQRRRDELNTVTGCTILDRTIPVVVGQARNPLPDTVLDLRRLTYGPQCGFGLPSAIPLWQSDKWGMDSYEPGYTTKPPGVPSTYLRSTSPRLTFDTDVPPAIPGNYELLTVESGGLLSPSIAARIIVPDDWTWILRWGALADLLSRESNAKDPLRAAYAEKRYREGLSLLANAPALLGLRIANVPLPISSVQSADTYQVGWQAAAPAKPSQGLVAGLNLVALSPTPDVSTYSLMATVVTNSPLPSQPSDAIPVTRDIYDVILDEAQHIASFKMGGAEFLATMALHQRFLALAAVYSSKLAEMGEFTKILLGISQRQESMAPRMDMDLAEVDGD